MGENINTKYSIKKLITLLFILSFLTRIIYGIYYNIKYGSSNFADDWVYIEFAQAMLKQGVFVTDISEMTRTTSGITPFYPFVIFISFEIFGINYIPLIILNAVLSSTITIVIYFIGEYLFGEKVGILCSIWTVVYINFIRWVPTLLKENLIQFLFAIFVFLIILYLFKKQNYIVISLMALNFAVLIHTDERYIVYYIFLIIILFLNKRLDLKRKLLSFVYLSVLVLAFMLPWLIRNYDVYDRPVLLSERTTGITDKFLGYKNENHFSQEIQINETTLDSITKGIPIHDISLFNLLQRGISYGTYPRKFSKIEKMYVDFKELWRPFRFSNMWVSEGFRPEGKWSLSHNLSLILTYGILLPFFLFGVYHSIISKNKGALILVGIILTHTLIHTTFILSQNRYRIPIDTIIIVFAMYGFTQIMNKYYLSKNKLA